MASSLETDQERSTSSDRLHFRLPTKTLWLNCPQWLYPATDFCHPAGLDVSGKSLHLTSYQLPTGFQAALLCCPPQPLMPPQPGPHCLFPLFQASASESVLERALSVEEGGPTCASPRVSSGCPRWLPASHRPLTTFLGRQGDYSFIQHAVNEILTCAWHNTFLMPGPGWLRPPWTDPDELAA